jgi:hypothetical protein
MNVHTIRQCATVAGVSILIISTWSLVNAQKRPARPVQSHTLSATEIANRTMTSTVYVEARDAQGKMITFGSGFFFGLHYVMTNFHVVEDAHQIIVGSVTGRGHAGSAVLQYADAGRDLAVLECDCAHYDFPCLPLSISSAERQAGEKVYAVGNPRGLLGTFSEGIISGFRDIDGTKYLQITAPISPGSSGGPVVDEHGEVVGVATAFIKEAQNLNLAVSLPEELAYALYRIARVSKPRTLAGPLIEDVPPASAPAPMKSYAVQITAMVNHQALFAKDTHESGDLATYYNRYSNPDLPKAIDLQWTAFTASRLAITAAGFLGIYQTTSSASDRSRITPIIKDQLSQLDEELSLGISDMDLVLKTARYQETVRLAHRLQDELSSCQSLIRSIKID